MVVSDVPCVTFSEELIKAYPEAKVILTMPPAGYDRWYQSCCNTIMALKEDRTRDAWALLNHEAALTRNTFSRCFDIFWAHDFRNNARRIFDRHSENMRRLVPADGFLEYNVTQGWEPLCEFLGREGRKDAFPSGNHPQDFFRRFAVADQRRRHESIRQLVMGVGASVGLVWVAWKQDLWSRVTSHLFG